VILAAAYVFLVFGFLSRRCERQADIHGCRTVSCGDPNCIGHVPGTAYPELPTVLCPTGIRTFIRALERVDHVNDASLHVSASKKRSAGDLIRGFLKWLRSWQHSTMSRRVAFLQSLMGNPGKEQTFQARVTVLRWGLLVVLATAFIVLGQMVGWNTLLKAL
jgi:STE24 endopeptidase